MPQQPQPNRRSFLQASATASAAAFAGGYLTSSTSALASGFKDKTEQPVVGFVGAGIRYHTYLGKAAMKYGPCAAIADVDARQLGRGLQVVMDNHRAHNQPLSTRAYEDYRKVLDHKDINAVVIGTVDHWHTKIAIDAMRAGKDVYCEKPLTLTIKEGQQILKVMGETGRVFQVGTQQRSEFNRRFVTAAAMARDSRVGKMKKITVCLGGSRNCDPLPAIDPPKHLNWELWQGQCPVMQYREAPEMTDVTGWGAGHNFGRAHRYYRWFYEYSGGKLTDWGAHHVDVALWAMNLLGEDAGKVVLNPISVNHPVKLDEKGYPTEDDRFNCAIEFNVSLKFDDGLELFVRDKTDGFDNGIMFEGEKGRYFVNRGKITGKPVEQLKANPLDESRFKELYVSGERPEGYGDSHDGANMKTFMECIKSRKTPSSDVASHHKAMNICHAINIAMRLNRELTFDTKAESFVGDDEANTFVAREQRKGYEIDA